MNARKVLELLNRGKLLVSLKYKNSVSLTSLTLPIVFKWLNYKIPKYERDSLGQISDILWLFEEVIIEEEERVTFL